MDEHAMLATSVESDVVRRLKFDSEPFNTPDFIDLTLHIHISDELHKTMMRYVYNLFTTPLLEIIPSDGNPHGQYTERNSK